MIQLLFCIRYFGKINLFGEFKYLPKYSIHISKYFMIANCSHTLAKLKTLTEFLLTYLLLWTKFGDIRTYGSSTDSGNNAIYNERVLESCNKSGNQILFETYPTHGSVGSG